MTYLDLAAAIDAILAEHLANERQRAGIVAEILQKVVQVLEDE